MTSTTATGLPGARYPDPVVPRFWRDTEVALADAYPWFKPRAQQATLTAHMWDVLQRRSHGAVEAKTGTGKSISCLMVAEALPGRVVISTATRALQSQYRDVDIPMLQSAGLLTKDVVILDGRGRWLCVARAKKELAGELQAEGKRILKRLLKALDKDPSQRLVRDLLPVGVPDWLWTRISSDPDACQALGCAPGSCAYLTERDRARSAGIVIVNHSLLLADASLKAGSAVAWGRRSPSEDEPLRLAVLGPYRHLIVDEAHALEAAAESHGERRASVRGIQSLVTRVKKLSWPTQVVNFLEEAAAQLQNAIRKLPQNSLLEAVDNGPVLLDAAGYAKRAAQAARDADSDPERTAVIGAACNSLAERLADIDSALRFGEDELGPRAPSAYEGGVVSQLIDAGPWLRKHLWDQVPAVLMSGTLTVPGRSGFVMERVGLAGVSVLELPAVFDYNAQRLVFVTPRADSGGGARVNADDVAELEELLRESAGRALILFPAVQDLRYVHDALDGTLDHRVLGQGVTPAEDQPRGRRGGGIVPMPNARLAELFREDTSSVLLATRSFFEGQDFPGEACSLVVIARFPNLRPDDPLTLARRRLIESNGGNAWVAYQEPSMQLLFRQAAGRAIRRVDDRGVVAVLDPRSGSKQYAKRALLSLLPSGYTDSLDDVGKFLNSGPRSGLAVGEVRSADAP